MQLASCNFEGSLETWYGDGVVVDTVALKIDDLYWLEVSIGSTGDGFLWKTLSLLEVDYWVVLNTVEVKGFLNMVWVPFI